MMILKQQMKIVPMKRIKWTNPERVRKMKGFSAMTAMVFPTDLQKLIFLMEISIITCSLMKLMILSMQFTQQTAQVVKMVA